MFDQQFRKIVSVEDPAIDLEATGDAIEKYAETRDERLLTFHAEQTPRRYVVRRLTRGEREFVDSRPLAKRCSFLIQIALIRVEEPDGTETKPTKKIPDISGRRGEMQLVWDDMPGGELDALSERVELSEWIELANVIETMAGMRLGEAYGSSAARFALLPVSQAALGRIGRLRAERS